MIAQSHEGIGRTGSERKIRTVSRESNSSDCRYYAQTERQLVEGLPQGYVRHEWLADAIDSPCMARAVLLW
jgi:hypothetical protein